MQRLFQLFFLLAAFGLGLSGTAAAKPADDLLHTADSLFAARQYVQAVQVYEQLLSRERFYTQSMLLRMAYVKEASGDYVSALYYLQVYHQKHPSRRVLKKMEALAQQHELSGYEYSDYALFTAFVDKYYLKALELMMMAAVIGLTFAFLRKLQGRRIPVGYFVLFGLFLSFLFFYLNFMSLGRYGIVSQDNLLLMNGPSAGSQLVQAVPKGNRVALLDQEDIWYRIQYRDQTAYVRQFGILPLPQ